MKKFLIILVAIILLTSSCANAETPSFTVKVDGNVVTFPDAQPFIDSASRTMVPVRFVSSSLGASVDWDATNKTVIIKKDNDTYTVKIDDTAIHKGKEVIKIMDTVAIIKDSRTFVPARFIAEALGGTVSWDSSSRTVLITTKAKAPADNVYKVAPSDILYGNMVRPKARIFENLVFDSVKISNDGTITGTIPNMLSEGFFYGIGIYYTDNNGRSHVVFATDKYDFKPINVKVPVPISQLSRIDFVVEINNSKYSTSGSQSKELLSGKVTEIVKTGY